MNSLEDAFINIGLDEDNNNNSGQDLHNHHQVQAPASIRKSIKVYLI